MNFNITSNTNLLTAQDIYNYSNTQSSLLIELGAKVGNAYVDTGYAVYGIVEASQQLADASNKLVLQTTPTFLNKKM